MNPDLQAAIKRLQADVDFLFNHRRYPETANDLSLVLSALRVAQKDSEMLDWLENFYVHSDLESWCCFLNEVDASGVRHVINENISNAIHNKIK